MTDTTTTCIICDTQPDDSQYALCNGCVSLQEDKFEREVIQ
ncbi:hypothetical protein [Natrinema gelatinilyticum]|nr:hypothetical protein [Natrinema gelatinilyticum]